MMNFKRATFGLSFLIALLCLCGCQPSPENFYKVDYSGHTYIIYDGGNFDSGVVHDPDCKHDK